MAEFLDLKNDEFDALWEKMCSSIERLKQNEEYNSAKIYLYHLEKLFENEEFCKSKKFVNYLKEQIEIMKYLLDDSYYDPVEAENLRSKYIIDERICQARSNGGNETSKHYREVEKEIISRAAKIIENPHDSRPKEYYRSSSLADAVISTNQSDKYNFHRISIPEKSTVISYIKKAVKNGELPAFLTGHNPGKW